MNETKTHTWINSLNYRDEDRDRACDNLKSSSSEESVRKRRPSASHPKTNQLYIYPQTSHYSEIDANKTTNNDHTMANAVPVAAAAPAAAITPQLSNTITAPTTASVTSVDNSHAIPSAPVPIPATIAAQVNNGKSIDAIDHPSSLKSTLIGQKTPVHKLTSNNSINSDNDFHYETLDQAVKAKYAYHDEPHSFENSMDFLEDYNHYQFEVLETTVWLILFIHENQMKNFDFFFINFFFNRCASFITIWVQTFVLFCPWKNQCEFELAIFVWFVLFFFFILKFIFFLNLIFDFGLI